MRVRGRFLVFALSLLAAGLTIKPVAAATASASIGVSATVEASCRAAVTPSANGIRAASTDAASAVAVSCSNSEPYNVTLDAGTARGTANAMRTGSGSRFPAVPIAPGAFSVRAANSIVVVVTY